MTNTPPVFAASLQITATVTGVVWCAVTLKVAEPLHVTLESVVLAKRDRVAGPRRNAADGRRRACCMLTSIEPDFENEAGPMMV